MKCNACWADITGLAFVTRCQHCFCERDARRAFSESMDCPACGKVLTRKDIKDVHVEPSEDFKAMALCGFPPEVIIDMCHAGIQFWAGQQRILIGYEQHLRRKTETRTQQLEKEHQDQAVAAESERKLLANAAKRTEEQLEMQRRDHRELQEKFSAVAREKNKVYELYTQLKRKHERLQQEAQVTQAKISDAVQPLGGAADFAPKRPRLPATPGSPFQPFALPLHPPPPPRTATPGKPGQSCTHRLPPTGGFGGGSLFVPSNAGATMRPPSRQEPTTAVADLFHHPGLPFA